jgi:hypothetical protein
LSRSVNRIYLSRKLGRSEKKVDRINDQKHNEKEDFQKTIAQLSQDKSQALDSLRKSEEAMIDLDEKVENCGNQQAAKLYVKNRMSKNGGRPQYPWNMSLLIIESLATGASISAVEKLLRIFPQTLAPNQSLQDRPKHTMISKCRSTMKILAEVCSTILLD